MAVSDISNRPVIITMPGFLYAAVWAVAIALLGKGAQNKMSHGAGASVQRVSFSIVTRDLEVQYPHRLDTPVQIHGERVAVCPCDASGFACDREACLLSRRSLVDTGAEMTCVSSQLWDSSNSSYAFGKMPVRIVGVTGVAEAFKVGWLRVLIRGFDQTMLVCIFDRKTSSKLGVTLLLVHGASK